MDVSRAQRDSRKAAQSTSHQTPIDGQPDPRLLTAMEFMRREFRRGPKLPEIARAAHLSPFHFHRSFRKHFGKTPKQVLAELQIAEVQRLILQGTSLGEAARHVGFAQQSHLTTRFKQVTGMTPTAWLLLTRSREGKPQRP
jgi:AraC-like DNA-binding protein